MDLEDWALENAPRVVKDVERHGLDELERSPPRAGQDRELHGCAGVPR
jgi:hypothetical protein